MAIRKYRKKMNGGNVLNKFKQGAFDVQDGAETLNEKRKQHMAEAELHTEAAKESYHSTLRSGAMGGTVPSPPVMNNLAIPPAMPPSPPQLGGKRRRKRRTRRRRKRGGENTIDWSQVDYDSWADKQAARDFGGVFNRGRGQITAQPARRRSKPEHHGKPYAKLTKDEDGEEIVTMGGRRKTRRRRKHKRKRRKTRRRRKRKRTRRRRR